MDVLEILAIIAAIIGIIGSIVPGLPGPPVSWIGILLLAIAGTPGASITFLMVWLAITVVVSILDYVIPAWTTRMTGGHKAASTGALLGLLLGMVATPVGMISGALIGAFIGELTVTDKGVWAAFKAGIGAFLGFILGTGLKLIASGLMLYYILKFTL